MDKCFVPGCDCKPVQLFDPIGYMNYPICQDHLDDWQASEEFTYAEAYRLQWFRKHKPAVLAPTSSS